MKNIFNNLFRKIQTRNDSWLNVMTNIGEQSGRIQATMVKKPRLLISQELEALYSANGIARRIVDCLVDDAMRGGFINCDEDLKRELNSVTFIKRLKQACCFSRLYGGAVLVAFLDDDLQLSEPVNFNRINKVLYFRTFNRTQISWTENDLNTNYLNKRFGEPEYYTISSLKNASDLGMVKIHASRCFVFDGMDSDDTTRSLNSGWGESVLQSCFNSLRKYGLINEASAEIIQDFIQVIIKINGLAEKMVAPNGLAEIQKRLKLIDISRSVANVMVLDGGEEAREDYSKSASSISGLAELWDRFSEAVCAETGYPVTRLFCRSLAGLNSAGTSDMRNYYDTVSAYRNDSIEPALIWALELIKNQRTWKKKPESFDWKFTNLIEQTASEEAQVKKTYAEIDCMYIDRGAIDAGEAWQERFGGGEFRENIELTTPEVDDSLSEDALELLEAVKSKKKEEPKEQESELATKTKKVIHDLYSRV